MVNKKDKQGKGKDKCHICGSEDHLAKDCPDADKGAEKSSGKKEKVVKPGAKAPAKKGGGRGGSTKASGTQGGGDSASEASRKATGLKDESIQLHASHHVGWYTTPVMPLAGADYTNRLCGNAFVLYTGLELSGYGVFLQALFNGLMDDATRTSTQLFTISYDLFLYYGVAILNCVAILQLWFGSTAEQRQALGLDTGFQVADLRRLVGFSEGKGCTVFSLIYEEALRRTRNYVVQTEYGLRRLVRLPLIDNRCFAATWSYVWDQYIMTPLTGTTRVFRDILLTSGQGRGNSVLFHLSWMLPSYMERRPDTPNLFNDTAGNVTAHMLRFPDIYMPGGLGAIRGPRLLYGDCCASMVMPIHRLLLRGVFSMCARAPPYQGGMPFNSINIEQIYNYCRGRFGFGDDMNPGIFSQEQNDVFDEVTLTMNRGAFPGATNPSLEVMLSNLPGAMGQTGYGLGASASITERPSGLPGPSHFPLDGNYSQRASVDRFGIDGDLMNCITSELVKTFSATAPSLVKTTEIDPMSQSGLSEHPVFWTAYVSVPGRHLVMNPPDQPGGIQAYINISALNSWPTTGLVAQGERRAFAPAGPIPPGFNPRGPGVAFGLRMSQAQQINEETAMMLAQVDITIDDFAWQINRAPFIWWCGGTSREPLPGTFARNVYGVPQLNKRSAWTGTGLNVGETGYDPFAWSPVYPNWKPDVCDSLTNKQLLECARQHIKDGLIRSSTTSSAQVSLHS